MGNTLRAQEMQHQQYRFVLCVIGLIAVVTASGGHKGKAKGKMPHATACKGKSVADRCSFTGKEGTAIQGICMKMQGQLVCGTASGKAKGKRDCHGKAKGKSGENQHHGIPSQAQGHSQLSQRGHGHIQGHENGRHGHGGKHKGFPWVPTVLIGVGVLAVVAASVVAAKMLCRHSEVKKVDIETATLVCSTPATGQVVDVPQKDAINAVVVSVKEPTAPLSQLDSSGAIPPKVPPAV